MSKSTGSRFQLGMHRNFGPSKMALSVFGQKRKKYELKIIWCDLCLYEISSVFHCYFLYLFSIHNLCAGSYLLQAQWLSWLCCWFIAPEVRLLSMLIFYISPWTSTSTAIMYGFMYQKQSYFIFTGSSSNFSLSLRIQQAVFFCAFKSGIG